MQHAREVLNLVLETAKINLESPQSTVFKAWKLIVGPDLYYYTKIVDINLGKLIIEVDHPARMQLVHMRQRKIINRMKKNFPSLGVNRIHLLVGNQTETGKQLNKGEIKRGL